MAVTYVHAGNPLITKGSSGAGATPDTPNHGVTLIDVSSSEVYTLMPPEAGVRKTIVFNGSSATTLTPTVRGSSAQTVTFSGGTLGGNTALPTMFKLSAGRSTNMAAVVELVGVSSVSWAVTSVHPYSSAGQGIGAVTFSTT